MNLSEVAENLSRILWMAVVAIFAGTGETRLALLRPGGGGGGGVGGPMSDIVQQAKQLPLIGKGSEQCTQTLNNAVYMNMKYMNRQTHLSRKKTLIMFSCVPRIVNTMLFH